MKINNENNHNDFNDINKLTRYEKFKLELKRVYYFYKEHIDVFILIIILSLILLISSNNKNISNILKKQLKQKGGDTEDGKTGFLSNAFNEDMKRFLFDIKNLERLKEKYPDIPRLVYLIWIISSYFIRPFKYIIGIVTLLFAISGSFIFPFLVYGIAIYYVFKKMIKNKSPNPKEFLIKKKK